MKRFWVIRFGKGLIKTNLYFSPLDGQLAFTPKIMESFGFGTEKDATTCRAEILKQIHDPNLKANLTQNLTIEEHVLGDLRN